MAKINVDRVPNEVLAEIFDYACDTNILQEYPWSKDHRLRHIWLPPPTQIVHPLHHLPAMSMSSVSIRWRSIALSSSAIWSRISLELSLENSQRPDVHSALSGFLRTVQLHLHLSAQRHLTLKLDTRGYTWSGDWGSVNAIPALLAFDLVCDHCCVEPGCF
ncbi:hypothetical protein BDP27DRAFT_1423914 [Rhodocollybia butyracea]|uniref:F-box domain-containing protein n=1 Tax=Rhodocollybia butyracea TaxID=206335 RepID=A0A9P5U626_9AGAR|nr:hypothetical protein BDP27DRAFT_1423914 [Rhodocollybia butyracea]